MKKAFGQGLFITFEGIEGVGKSTNLNFMLSWLLKEGVDVIATREPGGTEIAEKLREILLLDWQESISSTTELLLLFAGRAQHIENVIKPALAAGQCVLCDRFSDATYAYQGYGRGIELAAIEQLETTVQGDLRPDITFLFDAEVSIGQSRVNNRSTSPDRIEKEQADFFEKVRQGYLARAKKYPERYVIVDASQDLSAVQAALCTNLQNIAAAAGVAI